MVPMVKWSANDEALPQGEQNIPSHLDSISKQKETQDFNLQLRFLSGVPKARFSVCGSTAALTREVEVSWRSPPKDPSISI